MAKILATKKIDWNQTGRKNYVMTVESRFDNSFSITATVKHPNANDLTACGCMHEEIQKHFGSQFDDLIKLHLSDLDGVPMHAVANAYYFLAGACGGLGEKYHMGNCSIPKSPEECLETFQKHLRIDPTSAKVCAETAQSLFNIYGKEEVKKYLERTVDNLRPQWKKEAEECLKKYNGA